MKRTLLLPLVAVALLAGCDDQGTNEQAQQTQSNAVQTGQTEQTPQTSLDTGVSGVYCKTDEAERTLVIYQENGSPDILFGVSYWFANDHNCGISGKTAKLTGENVWSYETQMKNGSTCKIDVTTSNEGNITIAQTGDSCSEFCGAMADFDTTTFPASTKIKGASQEEAMQAFELDLCP